MFAQEFVARKLGNLSQNSNLTVTFENAIVPGWSDGKISFRKCFVSRRPKRVEKFIKGSQQEAYEESLQNEGTNEDEEDIFEDDGNYTQFDLTIEEVNISLSLNKWVNGTGMIETLELKGMREWWIELMSIGNPTTMPLITRIYTNLVTLNLNHSEWKMFCLH